MNEVEWITPKEAKEKINAGALLVDVRTPEETAEGYLKGALLINSEEVTTRIKEFGSDLAKEIVVYCKSGGRSNAVGVFLKSQGYKNVYNAGGYEDLKGSW